MTNTPASTLTRRIRRWARVPLCLAVPGVALAVPAVTATPAQAASDCSTDCVAVAVTPGVDRFTFGVGSAFPVKLAGRITTQDGKTQVSTTTTSGYGTSYSLGVS